MNHIKERDKCKSYLNRSCNMETTSIDHLSESKKFNIMDNTTALLCWMDFNWNVNKITLYSFSIIIQYNFQSSLAKGGLKGNLLNKVKYMKQWILTSAVIAKLPVHVKNILIWKWLDLSVSRRNSLKLAHLPSYPLRARSARLYSLSIYDNKYMHSEKK